MTASLQGLSAEEAAARLARDGPNELPAPKRRPPVLHFVDQLIHFFALMLWVAAALAFAAGLPEVAIAISAVIVLNAVFAFIQEQRADRATERLQALLPLRATVRRDGHTTHLDAGDVVVGDVLVFEPGDRVSADASIESAFALLVDTSLLTGESVPTQVDAGPVFAGTFVVEGQGEAVVSAVGANTRLAGIARLTTLSAKPTSPLTRELGRVVRTIAMIAIGVGVGFFGIALLVGETASNGLVFAIGVTVALVPEALLPTVTLSLAWGAEQMAKRNVLVRSLDAVETLGSTTFICTDKTGTLTHNRMAVVEAWTPAGTARVEGEGYDPVGAVMSSGPDTNSALERLAMAAARCSTGFARERENGWVAQGDPMEAALDVLARRVGVDTDDDRIRRQAVRRFPFDPRRRRMSVVIDREVLVKGAPDAVLPLCAAAPGAREAVDDLTGRGLRVLAVATRAVDATSIPQDAREAESDLRLLGLLALEDPPRADVHAAIESCRHAGIALAMVTGDHPATARSIALQTGLLGPDGIVISGEELPEDDADLGELLERGGVVVARVSPEDKLRIARALRGRGHVVAMTGDGVNDGPALHEADIGIAMGESGSDVAREAADLVLLDDHFATIVAGIEQGRATFLNVRRFLTYHLTDNVAELTPFVIWALSGGRFPLALGVLQILALDIGTDTFSAVALGAEPPARNVLDGPPVSGRLLNRTVARRAFGLLGPTIALGTMVAFLASYVAHGWRPGDSFPGGRVALAASGGAFMTVVIAQAANAFACRSFTRWPGALGWTTNRLLPVAVVFGLSASLMMLFVGPIADQLGQVPPPTAGWLVAVGAAGALLAVDAADKHIRRRKRVP